MRIQRLEVEGFRSLKKVSWEPGALNVVIGPNGSGKSNLLKYLDLFSYGAQGELRKYIQRLGGIFHAAWNNEYSDILIRAHIDGASTDDPSLHPIYYETAIHTDIRRNDYYISSEILKELSEDSFARGDINVTFFANGKKTIAKTVELTSEHDLLISIAKSPFQLDFLPYRIQGYFSSFSVFKQIDTSDSSDIRHPVIAAFEKTLVPDGSNLIQVLHTLYTSDRNFESDIDSAMNAAFGNDYEKLVFPPAADQRVQLRIRWKSLKREQSALDISDGTLRFLYLLAILANPDPSPLIAIDEPETGLHPSMFPIIADFARECSRKSQVIFTTHSPQFLDAFGDNPPTTTVAQWQNGETHLKVLDGERLAKWLKHYSMGSMFMSGELEAFD